MNNCLTHAAVCAALILGGLSASSHAQESAPYVGVRLLTAELAQEAVQSAVLACRDEGYQVAAALVDRSGNVQALLRDPLAGPHSVQVSIQKAYAAATFQADTLALQELDMNALNNVDELLIVGGGLPISVAGHLYGGIGVSGAPAESRTGDIDDRCARAGVEAIEETLEFAE